MGRTSISTVVRVKRATLAKAQQFASQATGREVSEAEAIEICAESLDADVLDRVLDNVASQAQEWVTGQMRTRDRMWTTLVVQFAVRETGVPWKLTQKNGRLWLHREGLAPTTGEELAALDIEELAAEIRAGGASEEAELN